MFCTSPIAIYKRGNAAVLNAATGQAERSMVACGQCPTCQAGRKNDWAGRLVAEAKTAKQVYFLTLTYKKEPTDYHYRDVQAMLKHLRTDLVRNHGGKGVRFFCVGERGNKFGRIHWHILLFFDAPHHMARTKPKELWQFWPHGWTSIDLVPQDDIVRRVRYCAKYAVKTVGDDKSCRLRCSLKPAIGGVFLKSFAADCAEQGLPLKGFFFLPGMIWERGHRKGEHVRYRLKGSSARRAAEAYCDRWVEVRPSKPWPSSNFLSRYYPQEMAERHLRWPETNKAELGKLADGQKPRLWVRPRDEYAAKLMGVSVNVQETEAEQLERLEQERADQERADWADLDAADSARRARSFDVTAYGLDRAEPQVAFYVETGVVHPDTFQHVRDVICSILDRQITGHRGKGFEPEGLKLRHDFYAERHARRVKAWGRGLSAEEECDVETGEVFERFAPRPKASRSAEVAEQAEERLYKRGLARLETAYVGRGLSGADGQAGQASLGERAYPRGPSAARGE